MTVPSLVEPAPSSLQSDVEHIAWLRAKSRQLSTEIGKRIIGQKPVVDLLMMSLFAKSHSLFVGVPGLAKTLLIQTLAESVSMSFNRVQFTPDLMPSDITGTDVLEEDRATGQRTFRFLRGPVFANIVLADEINRTPPKTQAALLQAMQEQRVSVGGQTYSLPDPALVFATQNPVEQEGTYPLPEAQLDRFLFLIEVGYPTAQEEATIAATTTGDAHAAIHTVMTTAEVLAAQALVRRVPVPDSVVAYAVALARATRPGPDNTMLKDRVHFGAGPRASQGLVLAAKTRAALDGRFAPTFDDVRAVAVPVLAHRLVLAFQAQAEGQKTTDVVADLLKHVPTG
jgi:MoxR-like ATPase